MAKVIFSSTYDVAVVHTVSILERLLPARRPYIVRLWDGTEVPATGTAQFVLKLNHPGALRSMLRPPVERSFAEGFIYGAWDIEGDIFAAFHVLTDMAEGGLHGRDLLALVRGVLALPSAEWKTYGRGRALLAGALHSRQRDAAAIRYHYDVGNEFYRLWLDQNMQYSCAYFASPAEDLEQAQQRKMDHICRKLRLQPGERLLDIGCGWGGLARYAAAHYQAHVTGVTLSKSQAGYAQEKVRQACLSDRVDIRLLDYRDLQAEPFDKMVSVGMFEHVGRSHLPEYFSVAYRLLAPGGLFLNHGIASRRPPTSSQGSLRGLIERRLMGSGTFIQGYVFPDGELVTVSEANTVAEAAGFEVRDVENLREHYALTLRRWVTRLQEHQEEAIAASDEATYRTWRLFMAASAYGFETARANVNQSLLSKPVAGNSRLPLTRADVYHVP